MLFLIAVPIVSCVVLFWRYLQIYAPSNLLVRRVRSTAPRWRSVPTLLALAAALLLTMHIVSRAVGHGAPGWLNLLVLVLAWDAIKVSVLVICVALRLVIQAVARIHSPGRHPRHGAADGLTRSSEVPIH